MFTREVIGTFDCLINCSSTYYVQRYISTSFVIFININYLAESSFLSFSLCVQEHLLEV